MPVDDRGRNPREARRAFDGPVRPQDLGIGRLYGNVRDAVIVAEAGTGRIVLWNPVAVKIFGYPRSEALGLRVEALVPERLRGRHRAGISRYRDTGHGPYVDSGEVLDLPAVRKGGEEIRVELTLSPIGPACDDGPGTEEGEEGRFVLAIVRDVTERQRAEEELRRLNAELEERVAERTARLEAAVGELKSSEERYRLLVEGVKDYAIFMVDPEGRVTDWNSGAERLFGYKGGDIVGEPGSLLFTPEDLQKGADKEELRKAEDEGRAQDQRWHVRKDGSRFFASGFVRPVRDEEGNLRGFAKVARDITERKEAEDRLRESEERFRATFEQAAVGVAHVSTDGRLLRLNDKLCEIFGRTREEMLGLNLRDISHPEDLDADLKYVRRMLAGETDSYSMEKRYFRKDGSPIWTNLAVSVVRHPSGEAEYLIGAIEDITERKRAEEELRRSSERITNILESITDAFFALDKGWRFAYLNRQAEVLLQSTREELLGKKVWEQFPEAMGSTFYERYHEALASDEPVQFEEFYPPLGEWFEVKAYPSEEGLSVYFRDVTERRRTQEFLRRYATILDATTDYVGTADASGRALSLNRAGRRMVGIGDEEDVTRTAIADFHPDWASAVILEQGVPAAIRDGSWSGETALISRDGREIPVSQVILAHKGARGEVEYLSTIARDISERKRFEVEHQRLASVVENSSDFIGIAGLDGRAIFVNKAGQRLVGLEGIEEVRQTRVLDYFFSEDRAFVRSTVLPAVVAEGRWVGELDFRHFKTGERIPVIWDVFRIDDPSTGNPINIATVTRDITDRRRYEERLRARAHQQEAVADLGRRALAITDIQALMDEAVRFAARVLEVEYCQILELLPDGEELLLRAGAGWKKGSVGHATVDAGLGSQAGYALLSDEPVVVGDLRRETRFSDPFLLHEHNIVSGISAVIRGRERPFGVLGMHTKERRIFTGDDVNFLRALANVLAAAIERGRAEEDLREQEAVFRSLSASSPVGIFLTDLEGRCTYTNPRYQEICGFSFEEALGEGWANFVHPKDREEVFEQWSAFTRAGSEYSGEFRFVNPRRGTRWVHVRSAPMSLNGGEPVGHVGTVEDITERRQAEEEIRARAYQQAVVSKLGHKALAETDLEVLMDEAVALVGDTLGVEYCKVLELLPDGGELLLRAGVGWKEGLVGRATVDAGLDSQAGYTLLSDEPVVVEDLRTEERFSGPPLLHVHGVVSGMSVIIHGGDGPFGVLGAHTKERRVFTGDDANFLQTVANVLSTAVQRKEAEEQLREVREAERSRLARDLHDDALQDLTYALAEAQLVQKLSEDPDLNQRLERVSGALKRAGQGMRDAIYDLHLEGGASKQTLVEMLESVVELIRRGSPDCEIDLFVEEDFSPRLSSTQQIELLRILRQALTNALRHSGADRVHIAVGTSSGGKLWAEVKDDGRGFDPTKTAAGVGLKGMRERARALGGDLQVSSRPGEGTKVRVELSKQEWAEPQEGVRILLVEDHASVRQATASVLEGEPGFSVVGQGGSLAEARQLLDGDVDVAVVDLGLPDGYGGELIKELRKANPQAQALVLSASLDRAEVARAVECGAAGVLHKSVGMHAIIDAVRRLKAGEPLMPLEEVVELLRFAGSHKEQQQAASRAIARLTPREKEVLQALAEGLDSREIAERLHISVQTERNHVASILAKLGAHSRLQALVFALRHGVAEIR